MSRWARHLLRYARMCRLCREQNCHKQLLVYERKARRTAMLLISGGV